MRHDHRIGCYFTQGRPPPRLHRRESIPSAVGHFAFWIGAAVFFGYALHAAAPALRNWIMGG